MDGDQFNWTNTLLFVLYAVGMLGTVGLFLYYAVRDNGRAQGIRNFGLQLLYVVWQTCKFVLLPGAIIAGIVALISFLANK